MKRIVAWAQAHSALILTAIAAFTVGLLIGAVLGWWRLGDRSINWGTAGEWVPGLATGLLTAGALLWAVRAFLTERTDLQRTHAVAVDLDIQVTDWTGPGSFRAAVDVANYGLAAIRDVVVFTRVRGTVEWSRRYDGKKSDIRPGGATAGFINIHPLERSGDIPPVEAWVEFRDVEQRWWRRHVGGMPLRLHQPSREALSARQKSWE
jgi:hypothetical protein